MIEVYPQVRFFTEVRFNNKPYATMVAGMPESSRNSGSFDGMQGNFFSTLTANEAIIQVEFAKELAPIQHSFPHRPRFSPPLRRTTGACSEFCR